MKILILNNLYAPYKIGGAEKSVQSLAEKLVQLGNEVGVITLGVESNFRIINEVKIWRFQIKNIYWPYLGSEKSWWQKLLWHIIDTSNKRYKQQIKRVIQDFQPEIINTNNLAGLSVYAWGVAKSNNIRVVHTLRDYYLQCPKSNKFKSNNVCVKQCLECKILALHRKIASKKVQTVVGISKHILESHTNLGYFQKAKREVVYNGFEIPAQEIRVKSFNKSSFINFGFIGQINKAKGVELLMSSLSKLEERANWKLYIAGNISEGYKVELQKYLSPNRVVFLGFIEPNRFFEKIDVLIVPSIWEEPFGRVVLEGVIRKKVVLGSSQGGIKELFIKNKSFLFNPFNEELLSLLKKIIDTPEFLNRFEFNSSLTKNFSLEKTTKKYLEIFKD